MHDEAENLKISELSELIDGIKVAMLTTIAANGELVSRPLQTRDREFDGDLWFMTSVDSGKVDELIANPHVNIAYADPEHDRYVSITGAAQLVRDRRRIHALWNEALDPLYFKNGRDDPDIALIQVHAHTAEAWCAGNNTVSRLFNFVRARLTGDPAALGRHAHVELRRA
jgi:general stress protein 26